LHEGGGAGSVIKSAPRRTCCRRQKQRAPSPGHGAFVRYPDESTDARPLGREECWGGAPPQLVGNDHHRHHALHARSGGGRPSGRLWRRLTRPREAPGRCSASGRAARPAARRAAGYRTSYALHQQDSTPPIYRPRRWCPRWSGVNGDDTMSQTNG
jgi:hypothetical protein